MITVDKITVEELKQLYGLLTKWLWQLNSDKSLHGWGSIVETRTQIGIEIKKLDPLWELN